MAYIIIRFILIVILIIFVFFLIIFIFKIAFLHIIIQLLELKSLASKPINSTGNELLLNVLTQLVVEFKTFLNISGSIIIVFIGRSLGGREEVEE